MSASDLTLRAKSTRRSVNSWSLRRLRALGLGWRLSKRPKIGVAAEGEPAWLWIPARLTRLLVGSMPRSGMRRRTSRSAARLTEDSHTCPLTSPASPSSCGGSRPTGRRSRRPSDERADGTARAGRLQASDGRDRPDARRGRGRHAPGAVVLIPGLRKTYVRRSDVLALLAEHTYTNDQVPASTMTRDHVRGGGGRVRAESDRRRREHAEGPRPDARARQADVRHDPIGKITSPMIQEWIAASTAKPSSLRLYYCALRPRSRPCRCRPEPCA